VNAILVAVKMTYRSPILPLTASTMKKVEMWYVRMPRRVAPAIPPLDRPAATAVDMPATRAKGK